MGLSHKDLFKIFGLLILTLSCSTVITNIRYHEMASYEIYKHNFENAIAILESNRSRIYDSKDRLLYYLDLGILHHYQGNYMQSNELLHKAETTMEELYTRSISRAVLSILINDNLLEYSGEAYEDIYINIIKAINFLQLEQFDNAFVEVRRINDKLVFLEDKYKKLAEAYNQAEEAEIELRSADNRFHNSALGRYLSMLIYAHEGNFDSARIDHNYIKNAFLDQTSIYTFPKPDIPPVYQQHKVPYLNIMAFTGKAPYKKAFERRITTYKGYIVVSGNEPVEFYDMIYWPDMEKDFHFKLSLPFMQRRDTNVYRIEVIANNIKIGRLELIEDIGNIAVETFSIKQPFIYLRAVIRTVAKGLLAERAKARMQERTGELGGFLLKVLTDTAVDISENADLRTSRYLPGQVLIGSFELSPGVYDIEVRYYNRQNNLLYTDQHADINISRDSLNLINTFYLN